MEIALNGIFKRSIGQKRSDGGDTTLSTMSSSVLSASVSALAAQDDGSIFSFLPSIPSFVEMTMSDSSSFYGLNERIVAAESCWFAAKVGVSQFKKITCIMYPAFFVGRFSTKSNLKSSGCFQIVHLSLLRNMFLSFNSYQDN